VGNAAIAGMTDDLGLVGSQYNIALTMFFIPYALLEVPSNIILKLMRPSWWIAIMMFAWGVVMYAIACRRVTPFTKSYQDSYGAGPRVFRSCSRKMVSGSL
jgi:hypothetical protein